MATVLHAVADYLVRQSWQLSIVFGLVLAASWGLRKASAHWRYLLWLVVIAKCLTPPMLSLRLAVLPQETESQRNEIVSNASATPGISGVACSINRPESIPSQIGNQQASIAPSLNIRASSLAGSSQFDLRQWLVVAWLLVVGMILTYVSRKAWATHRRLQRARLPVDQEIRNMVASLAKGLGMIRTPTVYMVALSAQPFVWGWIRGDIYFPLQFAKTVSAEQQRAILTHELAHVARWDAGVITSRSSFKRSSSFIR